MEAWPWWMRGAWWLSWCGLAAFGLLRLAQGEAVVPMLIGSLAIAELRLLRYERWLQESWAMEAIWESMGHDPDKVRAIAADIMRKRDGDG